MIIDAHTHAYPPHSLQRIQEHMITLDRHLDAENPHKWSLVNEGTVDALRRDERSAGVAQFAILPVTSSAERVSQLNQWILRHARCHPEIVPFATLLPWCPSIEVELDRLVRRGVQGIKLHTLLQRFSLEHPETRRLLGLIQETDLPVVLDTVSPDGVLRVKPHLASFFSGIRAFGAGPEQIEAVARTFPRLVLVAAHLGCLYGWDRIHRLYELDNVYFDTAFVARLLPPEEGARMIREKGVERVIFGSDMPWCSVTQTLEWINRMDLDESERERILYRNFLDLIPETKTGRG